WWPWFDIGADATEMFENAGVKVLTDAYIHKEKDDYRIYPPPIFLMRPGEVMNSERLSGPAGPPAPPPPPRGGAPPPPPPSNNQVEEPVSTRTIFPETWIWALATTGPDGNASVTATVPDTITKWV
ncbi:unnamed protein product, partial [Owenia fusiformis]